MMKKLTSQEFLSSLSAQKPLPGYLIIGEDGYWADKVYRAIRSLIKRTMPVYDTVIVYGDEVKPVDLNEHLDSYSIFASNRLILLRNAHRLGEEDRGRLLPGKDKPLLAILANYLEHPDPSMVLVIIAEKVDGRISEWKKIKDNCQIVECEKIRHGGGMSSWLESYLRSHQKSMDKDVKVLFLEKVELDFLTAENELDKLLILVGDRKNITLKDIHTAMPTTRIGTQADFFRALGNRQTAAVLDKVLDMLNNEWVGMQILSMVFRFFLSIWKIQTLRAMKYTQQEIVSKHLNELYENQRREYPAFASNYKPDEMPGIFETILETDAQLKLSKASPETLMTICITRICNGIS
jgi:DNA polymerase-3 subunit delta